jgi:DNA polymerase-4
MLSILHIDMDAFFAAIEVMDHPQWAGKPLVVGSPPTKRGVVSTASYEARKYGVHSAMPSRTAYSLCPHAIFAPVRMSRYLDVSEQVMHVLTSFTPMIEQVSVDEAFLDGTGVLRAWKSPQALAIALKQRLRKQVGLTASVGIATNKFLAKLASDMNKPDGLTLVPETPEAILEFLAPMPVNRIWGVGKVTEKNLHQAGFRRIADLQMVSIPTLVPIVGPALADHLWRLSRGLDDRVVATESVTKSISAENTFEEDVTDMTLVRRELVEMAEQVGRRLRTSGNQAMTVSIKLRFEDFQTVSRQETLERPVCSDRRLLDTAVRLLARQQITQPVRLIGFGVSGLVANPEPRDQLELFADDEDAKEKRDGRLDRATDLIKQTMGKDKIRRGSTL